MLSSEQVRFRRHGTISIWCSSRLFRKPDVTQRELELSANFDCPRQLTSLVGLFIPYSRTMDMILAGAGTLIFSAYIVFDTHLLLRRLHVDDWIFACISLYLE